jgi:hypothetical protein
MKPPNLSIAEAGTNKVQALKMGFTRTIHTQYSLSFIFSDIFSFVKPYVAFFDILLKKLSWL